MKIARVINKIDQTLSSGIIQFHERFPCTKVVPDFLNSVENGMVQLPLYQALQEKSLMMAETFIRKSNFSKNPFIANIEGNLAKNGVNVRFKNKQDLAEFVNKGLESIKNDGYNLPENILIVRPGFIKHAGGAAVIFNYGPKEKAPVFFPKNLIAVANERIEKKYGEGFYSTNNPFYYIHHEVGHWLHFQDKPSLEDCIAIWQSADCDLIEKEVSKTAVLLSDGSEFVAEVFAGLLDGKKYSAHVLDMYKRLNGPTKKVNHLIA